MKKLCGKSFRKWSMGLSTCRRWCRCRLLSSWCLNHQPCKQKNMGKSPSHRLSSVLHICQNQYRFGHINRRSGSVTFCYKSEVRYWDLMYRDPSSYQTLTTKIFKVSLITIAGLQKYTILLYVNSLGTKRFIMWNGKRFDNTGSAS
jgi:hypothetical protein